MEIDAVERSGPERRAADAPSFGRALRSRPFLLLWSSELISQSGDFVFDVALIWLVLQSTGSIFAVGIVVTAALVPAVALGPVLGVYVDRWPRRTILLGANVAQGVVVAALAGLLVAGDASLAAIVGIVLALGVGGQFVRLASGAMIPQTVDPEDLTPANSLNQISGSTTQIVGLSIGGVIVGLFGPYLPITYDALTFFAAALIVAFIARSVGRPEPLPTGGSTRFGEQFREGLSYLRGQRYLLEIIALGVVVNFCGNATFALWAPYAEDVLHGGAETYGFLGAAVAAGAVVGAIVVGKVSVRHRLGPLMLGGLAAAGLIVVGLGVTHNIPAAIAGSLAFGAITSVLNVPLFAAVQAKVPARLMGRVMAVLLSLILVAAPLGAFFAGAMAQATSIGLVFIVLGLVIVAVSGVGAAFMGELRRLSY